MNATEFKKLVSRLTVIPEAKRKELLRLADGLSDAERQAIAMHVESIGADLEKNTQKQTGLISRADVMLTQIIEQDFPSLGLSPHV